MGYARILLSSIKVTSTYSFWAAVTQTADYRNGRLMGWDTDITGSELPTNQDFQVAPLVSNLQGTVILMARTVMQVC